MQHNDFRMVASCTCIASNATYFLEHMAYLEPCFHHISKEDALAGACSFFAGNRRNYLHLLWAQAGNATGCHLNMDNWEKHMVKKAGIAVIGLCCFICNACGPLGSDSTLEQRVREQDMQLRQMQSQQADAWNQIQAMRQENEALKGQLDDLNNAGGARAMAERLRQHDAALRQVDNNMALNLDLGSPMAAARPSATVPTTPVDGMSGISLGNNAPDSSAYGANRTVPPEAGIPSPTAPAPGNYGLPAEASTPAGYQAVQAPSETTWGQADPKPELQVPKKDLSLALFDAGVNSYNSRNYDAAERSFSDFLKNYPNHTQTAEAQYYLAECQFQRNRFPEAALAYDTVIKKYGKSSSAPGAYLKQGICFSKMNQRDAARARMQELISKFPNSPEAARAKNFLKTNK